VDWLHLISQSLALGTFHSQMLDKEMCWHGVAANQFADEM